MNKFLSETHWPMHGVPNHVWHRMFARRARIRAIKQRVALGLFILALLVVVIVWRLA